MTRLATLTLLLTLAGCSCTGGSAEDVPVFPRVPMPWSERGDWGEAVAGLSPRTCLGFAETRELPWVGLALRATDGSVCLEEEGAPPFNGAQGVQVLLDGEPVASRTSYPLKPDAGGPGSITVRNDHVLMVGPISFVERPADGEHSVEVVYTVVVEGERVEMRSPPLVFKVPHEG
jgi:hypothetical protein